MADHNKPGLGDGYANWPALLKARMDAIMCWLDGGTETNLPAGSKRWNAGGWLEKWTGTAWQQLDFKKLTINGVELTAISSFIKGLLDDADAAAARATLGAAPLNSPVFTGEPKAPTPPEGDDSERLATTEYVLRERRGYPGQVFHHAGLLPPAGALVRDGSYVPRASFAALFEQLCPLVSCSYGTATAVVSGVPAAVLQVLGAGVAVEGDGIAAGVTILSVNAGAGTMTLSAKPTAAGTQIRIFPHGRHPSDGTLFRLPDGRGEIDRGVDAARGVDAGRVLGSAQGDAIRNITGRVAGGMLTSNSGGASPTGAFYSTGTNGSVVATGSSRGSDTVFFDASLVVPTASENRMRNVAYLPCIWY